MWWCAGRSGNEYPVAVDEAVRRRWSRRSFHPLVCVHHPPSSVSASLAVLPRLLRYAAIGEVAALFPLSAYRCRGQPSAAVVRICAP